MAYTPWYSLSDVRGFTPAETERVAAEDSNLREALNYGLSQDASSEEQETALNISDWLFGYWDRQGYWKEGLDYLTRSAALSDRLDWRDVRVRLLQSAGTLAHHLGDYEQAQTLSEQGLQLAISEGYEAGIPGCIHATRGIIAFSLDEYARAKEMLGRALDLYKELEDKSNIAATLVNLSNVAFFVADHTTAQLRLEEALTITRQLDDRYGIATALHRLGNVRRNSGISLGKGARA